jgi:flagellar protein FlaG
VNFIAPQEKSEAMSANLVALNPDRLTTSENDLSRPVEPRRSIGAWKPENHDRLSEPSQVQDRQVHVTDQISGATVTFVLDQETQELYIQVVDRETGEVLREIPPVEMRRLAAALEESPGTLFDEFG